MRTITSDIWEEWRNHPGSWICIPTCRVVRSDGKLVMGAGLAKEAAMRFPNIPKVFGRQVPGTTWYEPLLFGRTLRIIGFPTKDDWRDDARLSLVEASAKQLDRELPPGSLCFLPTVGCGRGNLRWSDVEPILQRTLRGPNFVVIFKQ